MKIAGLIDFAKKVAVSGVSLVAANYTAQGIEKGIRYVVGKATGIVDDVTEATPSNPDVIDVEPQEPKF